MAPDHRKMRGAMKCHHLLNTIPYQQIFNDLCQDLKNEKHSEWHQEIAECLCKLTEQQSDSTFSLKQLKNVGRLVKKIQDNLPEFVLKSLVHFFIIANPRHPFKRAVLSILAKSHNDGETNTITVMSHEISGFISMYGKIPFLAIVGRDIVDLCTTCLDNNDMGNIVLERINVQVMRYMEVYLKHLASTMDLGPSTVEKIKLIHNVTATLKCCTAVIQRCITNPTKADTKSVPKDLEEILEEIVSCCRSVLQNENFEGDSWNTAGITWAIIWKTLLEEKEFLLKVQSTLNSLIKNKQDEKCVKSVEETDGFCNKLETMSSSAQLSLSNGLLVMMDPEELTCNLNDTITTTENEKCILLDYMLVFIQLINERSRSLPSEIFVAKCFVQWTRALRNCTKSCLPQFVKDSLLKKSGDSECVIDRLIQYSFIKLDHPVDAVRHQANEMLSDLLFIGNQLSPDKFAERLVENVLRQNWHKRSTFTALNCLLEQVTPGFMFKCKPDINIVLLDAMQQQSLAPYASETYRILAYKSKNQEKESVIRADDKTEFAMFLDPLFSYMCEVNHHYLRLLLDYCYTKLLKVYGKVCVKYMVDFFKKKMSQPNKSNNPKPLAALMSCLRTAMVQGLLKHDKEKDISQINDENIWNAVSIKKMIISALVNQNDEVRLIAFALLCESSKPSCLMDMKDLEVLKYAIPFNVSCQHPAFRQQLLNLLKKLLWRLSGNMTVLSRKISKRSENYKERENESANLNFYCEFATWLAMFSASQLKQVSPYPKRNTCISLLMLVTDIFSVPDFEEMVNFAVIFSEEVVKSLFTMLSDPYEDVKHAAFNLLTNKTIKNCIKSVLTQEIMDEILSNALNRSSKCHKPEWCSDAAYHIKLYAVLHEDNQSQSNASQHARLCSEMLDRLDESVILAERNLFLSATTAPMYGLLHCLKCLLQEVNFKQMNKEEKEKWRSLISRIISSCFRVSEAVLPVVGSVSPEGHLPDFEPSVEGVDGGSDDAWNKLPEILQSMVLGKNLEDEQDEMKTRAIAQTILVCCWRSAKESSLLLQEATMSHIPLDSSRKSKDQVLSWIQLLDTGEHLRRQLMEARHRGAFEIASSAFKAYCPRLWKNEHAELSIIPENWLSSALADIEDPDRSKELCATRRSAGLPFLMQALLAGEKSPACNKNLHPVMTKLLLICCETNVEETSNLTAKIHAINILRGLVKDASLGEEILPYVSQCMQVALTGFGSSIWAVRNSSTLLYSALVTRIFGVKRDKKDDFSLKNRLSGHDFFTRLPGLHSFLVNQLQLICNCLDKGGHHALNPVVHPILLLLSRIYPSTMQPISSGISLAEFVPLILRCSACAVYKSRVASANALATVLSCDQCLPALQHCCDILRREVHAMAGVASPKIVRSSTQNRIHGILLQVKEILESRIWKSQQHSTDTKRSAVECVSSAVCTVFPQLGTSKNRCPVTRATLLELLEVVYLMRKEVETGEDEEQWLKVIEIAKVSLMEEIEDSGDSGRKFDPMPGHTILLQSVTKILMLLYSKSSTEISFLFEKIFKSGIYDVVHDSLLALLNGWETQYLSVLEDKDLRRIQCNIVQAIELDKYDHKIQALLYRLLCKVGISFNTLPLLEKTLSISTSCGIAHSTLLEAIIIFQANCMSILLNKKDDENIPGLTKLWIGALSSASESYENADDVRLAVADALLACAEELLLDKSYILDDTSVHAWRILVRLLSDEEAEVRKVATDTVHKVALGVYVTEADYPCVDTLAMEHAITTLILTHGRRHTDVCRHALREISTSEQSIVPYSLEKQKGLDDGNIPEDDQDQFPGLFRRSETNTYLDVAAVSRVARMGLSVLNDIEVSTGPVLPREILESFRK